MNSVNLIGRLTRDPEVRYTTTNNTLVCSFSLAVNRAYKQEGQPEADFINVVAWAKTGEFCSKYFTKGLQVGITGRMQTRNYDDKDGKKVYVTEVIAEHAFFADSKKDNNNAAQQSDGFTTVVDDSQLPF